MKNAYVLALDAAHALRLNKADVLALNKAHVLRLNNKICPVFRANTKEAAYQATFSRLFRWRPTRFHRFWNHFWSPLGGSPPSKLGVLDGAVMKKSKKHCTGVRQFSFSLFFMPKTRDLEPIRRSPAVSGGLRGSPRIHRIRCQRVRLRPYLPRAPGAKMTVNYLIPNRPRSGLFQDLPRTFPLSSRKLVKHACET